VDTAKVRGRGLLASSSSNWCREEVEEEGLVNVHVKVLVDWVKRRVKLFIIVIFFEVSDGSDF